MNRASVVFRLNDGFDKDAEPVSVANRSDIVLYTETYTSENPCVDSRQSVRYFVYKSLMTRQRGAEVFGQYERSVNLIRDQRIRDHAPSPPNLGDGRQESILWCDGTSNYYVHFAFHVSNIKLSRSLRCTDSPPASCFSNHTRSRSHSIFIVSLKLVGVADGSDAGLVQRQGGQWHTARRGPFAPIAGRLLILARLCPSKFPGSH